MSWLKPRRIFLTALSILILASNIERVMTQNGFPFFVPPQWSHDGSRIAIVEGTTIVIYDANSETMLCRLEGHTDTILDVAWSPLDFRLASASGDQTVKVWDSDTRTLLHTLTGHDEPVTQVIWSPDSRRLISSGIESETSLFMWNAETGIIELETNAGTIVEAAFNRNEDRVAASYSLWLVLLDGATLQPITQQPPAMCCSNRMESLAWSFDGSQIVTGSINGLITVWEAAALTQISQFPANTFYDQDGYGIPDLSLSWVRDVAFSVDGIIEAVSGDGTVGRWDTQGNLLEETQIGQLETASWSPYGARLAVQSGASSASISTESERRADMDGMLQVVTPFASSERLQFIAAACGADQLIGQTITDATLSAVIAQLESATADQIPPACAADLIAIAEAIQSQ